MIHFPDQEWGIIGQANLLHSWHWDSVFNYYDMWLILLSSLQPKTGPKLRSPSAVSIPSGGQVRGGLPGCLGVCRGGAKQGVRRRRRPNDTSPVFRGTPSWTHLSVHSIRTFGKDLSYCVVRTIQQITSVLAVRFVSHYNNIVLWKSKVQVAYQHKKQLLYQTSKSILAHDIK